MKGGGSTADGGNFNQDADEKDPKKAKKKHHHRKPEDDAVKADSAHKHKHHHHREKDVSASTPHQHHHKHRQKPADPTLIPKPTGVAPIPTTLASKIVQELHRENKPSPKEEVTPEKAATPQAIPQAVQVPAVSPSLLAKIRHWINKKILYPIFSRQHQITQAYSSSFLRTLKAIEKRFCANDAVQVEENLGKKPPLRFRGAVVEKANRSNPTIVDLSANTKPNKPPTLH